MDDIQEILGDKNNNGDKQSTSPDQPSADNQQPKEPSGGSAKEPVKKKPDTGGKKRAFTPEEVEEYNKKHNVNTEAVKRWQKRLGVKVDGLWGKKTEAAYQAYLKNKKQGGGGSNKSSQSSEQPKPEQPKTEFTPVRRPESLPVSKIRPADEEGMYYRNGDRGIAPKYGRIEAKDVPLPTRDVSDFKDERLRFSGLESAASSSRPVRDLSVRNNEVRRVFGGHPLPNYDETDEWDNEGDTLDEWEAAHKKARGGRMDINKLKFL